MKNEKGSILLLSLIVMSVCLIEIGFLAKSLMTYTQTSALRIEGIKAGYVAQSGLAYARVHFQELPTGAEPKDKPTLYAKLNTLTAVPFSQPESQFYLLRTSTAIYSVGSVKSRYRAIFKQGFTGLNGALQWGKCEKW